MTLAQRVSQTNLLPGEPGQQTTVTAFPEGTLLEAGKGPHCRDRRVRSS